MTFNVGKKNVAKLSHSGNISFLLIIQKNQNVFICNPIPADDVWLL